jgi:hypothetical protein
MKLTDKYFPSDHDAIKLSSNRQNKQNRKRRHKTSNKVKGTSFGKRDKIAVQQKKGMS